MPPDTISPAKQNRIAKRPEGAISRRPVTSHCWISKREFLTSNSPTTFRSFGLPVFKINAAQRFLDVEMPWFAISREPIPIEDAIGGVAVLLDLDNEITGSNRVQPAAWERQRVARPNRDAMNMRGDITALDGLNEAVTGTEEFRSPTNSSACWVASAIYQNSVFASPPNSAARRAGGWTCTESFSWASSNLMSSGISALGKVAENIASMILPEIVQSFSTERSMQDNALGFRSIADLP